MKKFLLSLATVAAGLLTAGATTVTFDTTTQGYENAQVVDNVTIDGVSFAFDKGSNQNPPTYYVSGTSIRAYGGNSITITAPAGENIIDIVFTYGSGDSSYDNTISANTGTFEGNEWTGSSNSVKFTISGTKGQRRFQVIEVTYGQAPAVVNPKIVCENNTVTITCATADAKIYYTTDGSNPTAASNLYSAPFTITESVTVKAIAILGEDSSDVVSYEAKFAETYDSFAAYVAANPTNGGTVSGPIYALYQNGTNLYVKDSKDGYMLLYGTLNETLNNGDIISWVSGQYKPYNGLPEMASPAIGNVEPGTTIAPVEIAIDKITTANLNQYVIFKGVSLGSVDGRNAKITDANGNTIALYNTFNTGSNAIEFPEAGTDYTVIGFVGCYGETLQITPVKFEGGQAGGGEIEDAITVAEALEIISGLAEDATYTAKVKGYITEIQEISVGSYGNATYTISDDLEATNKLIVYRGYWLNGDKFTAENQIAIGGFVVVEGDLVNFKNNTPEFTTGSKVLSYKAPEGGSTPTLPEGVLYQNSFNSNMTGWKTTKSDVDGFLGWRIYNSCAYVSDYFNSENHAVNSTMEYTFDLTNCTDVKMSFEQKFGYDFPQTQNDYYRVYVVSEGSKEYLIMANFAPAPDSGNWSKEWATNEFDLSEYDGTVLTIGFEYDTDGAKSRIWELQNFVLYGEGSLDGISNVTVDADAAPVYFNLQGVRVNNPENGIFIVVKGNKAQKVIF